MLLAKLAFNIDWKRKTLHIYHDNDEAEQITIDENGDGELLLDMFKSLNMAPLKGFIEELNEFLIKEQLQAVFLLWGNSKQIMLSDMNRLTEDKILTKKILGLGMDRGVLARGVNSTWKVIDKEIQKTMKESAERMKRGPIKEPMTAKESIARVRSQGFGISDKEDEGMVVEKGMSSKVDNQDIDIIDEETETTVHIIPEEPLKNAAIEMLQHRIKKLNELINDPNLIQNEMNDKHAMISERNKLQVELRNAEIAQSQTHYTQSTKINVSGSVTRIQKTESKTGSIREPKKPFLPVKKVSTKQLSSPQKPVRNKK